MGMMNSLRQAYQGWNSNRQLNALEPKMLSDLGLNRYDIYNARNMSGAHRGLYFLAQRTERAGDWLK